MKAIGVRVQENVPLAPRTTLGVGGPARRFARIEQLSQLAPLLDRARDEGWKPMVLGGGSNLLVADRGVPGLVIDYGPHGLEHDGGGGVRVEGGHDWDALVQWAVARGLAGLECLSGIPGRVGAAPLQNIGAYGQEVAETLETVEVVALADGRPRTIPAALCGFGYRTSRLKTTWAHRYLVTALRFRLRPGGAPTLRYRELERALPQGADLGQVRRAVLDIRRRKSMLLDPKDPDARSAGSFFTNPVVSEAKADELRALLSPGDAAAMPAYDAQEGQVKLSAAWLLERAGFHRGYAMGAAGLSSRHVLALVNRGGASASALLQLAAHLRRVVLERFGVGLVPEPRLVGFTPAERALLGLR